MAACSYADGNYLTWPVDLETANEHLRWNPYPRTRDFEAWTTPPRSPAQPQKPTFEQLRADRLETTMGWTEYYAERLTQHHEGRIIVNAETPGRNGRDPQNLARESTILPGGVPQTTGGGAEAT